MAQEPLSYDRAGSIATIRMDDGKANVMSRRMMDALGAALAQAEADRVVAIVTGRPGMFSGGYDMAMFRGPVEEVPLTVRAGGELVYRILSFPLPVVMACPGHAIAQGAFLLLAADVRIGAIGPFKVGLNEVAIGLTIPYYGVEAARQRLTPAWFNHATTTGTLYRPEEALVAGFFDRLVEPDQLLNEATAEAQRLSSIDLAAHAATKLRVRAPAIEAMRNGIDREFSS